MEKDKPYLDGSEAFCNSRLNSTRKQHNLAHLAKESSGSAFIEAELAGVTQVSIQH